MVVNLILDGVLADTHLKHVENKYLLTDPNRAYEKSVLSCNKPCNKNMLISYYYRTSRDCLLYTSRCV